MYYVLHVVGLNHQEQAPRLTFGWAAQGSRRKTTLIPQPTDPLGLPRVGDPSKELSGEFSLMLNKSLAPASGNYPIRRALS